MSLPQHPRALSPAFSPAERTPAPLPRPWQVLAATLLFAASTLAAGPWWAVRGARAAPPLAAAPLACQSLLRESTVTTDSDPATWQILRHERYRFALRFPPHLGIVVSDGFGDPPPLTRILLLENALSGTLPASSQPAALTIEVYDNRSRQPLTAWLDQYAPPPGSGASERERVTVGGAEGICIVDRAAADPGLSVYLASGPYVYRLVAHGEPGRGLLAHFTLLDQPAGPGAAPTPGTLTWEECLRIPGAVILESYPRRCLAPDGRSAVEPVGDQGS